MTYLTARSPTPLARKLRTALWVLGDTPDEIAAALAWFGIRGYREDSCRCPVAVYLAEWCGIDGPDVGYTVDWASGQVSVSADDGLIAFLDLFDGGGYPNLDAESPAGP